MHLTTNIYTHGFAGVPIILLFCLFVTIICNGASKADFASVRALADKGTPYITDVLTNFVFAEDVTELKITRIEDNLFIEGYIVGSPAVFPRNENLEIAWQQGSKSASPRNNARTLYLESRDGKYGFRLFFDNQDDAKNAGTLFGILKLNLKGATLVKEYGHYVITGLTSDNVLGFESGIESDLPPKIKTIAELSDDDIFTWVTLTDCEFVFKNGAYMNVRETFLPSSKTGRYTGNGMMNGWARLVCDSVGDAIYLGLDAKLENRRTGDGVPQGSGKVSGVLTKSFMPRYGKVREYTLRPPSLREIHFINDSPSYWMTVASWDWNSPSKGLAPAEFGIGTITTDFPGTIGRFMDCDNPVNEKPGENLHSRGTYGSVNNGALSLQGKTSDWWDWTTGKPRSITFEFSTEELRGESLVFAWTFAAGQFNQQTSYGYPSHWQVAYSLDGKEFITLPDSRADLHSLPYSNGDVGGMVYDTSAEAGIGYTEHLVRLPIELLGQKKVFVRLFPCDRTIANMAYLHRDVMEATEYSDGPCTVNIGEIQIIFR